MPMSEEMKRDMEEMLPSGHHNHHQPQHQQYNHDEYLKTFAGYKSDERLKKQLKVLGVAVFCVTLGLCVMVNYNRDVEKRMGTHEPGLGPGATQAAPHHEHTAGGDTAHSQMPMAQQHVPAAQMQYPAQFPAANPQFNQIPVYGGYNQAVTPQGMPQQGMPQQGMPQQAMVHPGMAAQAMVPQAMPNGVYSVPLTRPGEILPPCMVVPIQDTHGNYRVKRIVGR